MANALTSGLKTYGEIRTRIGVVVAIIVSIVFCIAGWIIVATKDKHTAQTTGNLTNVVCSSNECKAVAVYYLPNTTSTYTPESLSPTPSPLSAPAPTPSQAPAPAPSSDLVKYSYSGTWPINSKEGQSVTIYYDPTNPSDATSGAIPKIMGWGFIGCATLVIILSILFMKFFSGLSNEGKAIVGGFEAAGNISSLLRRN